MLSYFIKVNSCLRPIWPHSCFVQFMLLETEILVGDVIQLSPTLMSTLDDLDLEKCTVLQTDTKDSRVKVVFNNDNTENETTFDRDSTIDWFSTAHVIAIERDYKVLELTDNQDTVTGQEVCIITMAKIKKTVNQTGNGYKITAKVDEQDTDNFFLAGFAAHELEELKETTNRIGFSQYKLRDAGLDDTPIKGWQPKIYINSPDDIFTMRDVG